MRDITIIEDDLKGTEIRALLALHQADALAKSPPGTSYALDLSGLEKPDITVFSAWRGETLVGCGAIKDLGNATGEIKSMRTAPQFTRQGVADVIVTHLVNVARARHYRHLYLETGTNDAYRPAVALYEKHGFVPGPIYGDYKAGPHNQFFCLEL